MEQNVKPTRSIFFSAAETSADKHTAALIEKIRKERPDMACDGLGGPAMEQAGCKLLENLVDRSAMLTHALVHLGFYLKLRHRVKIYLQQQRPDLVVVVDSPAWNFHVARAANNLGIPVLYYIAPQLWAWGKWRVKKLRRLADRLACILPFEQQWFRDHGITADYVGHPLFDEAYQVPPVRGSDAVQLDYSAGEQNKPFPLVALLPGSRSHELDKLWLPMQRIARNIKKEFKSAGFIAAAANKDYIKRLHKQIKEDIKIEIRHTSIEAITRHADLAIVASGTATLEVAAQHCPMIVMYHVNPLHWYLAGRWLIKTKHISLVNILADKELVPEFVPCRGRLQSITHTAINLLNNNDELEAMSRDLEELVKPIIQPGAADNVVQIINEMLPIY